MTALDSLLYLLLGVAGLAAVIALVVVRARAARARRRATRRVVEEPNSHYTSHLARDVQAKHRWEGIALERVHEINRGEVVRLLARVEASGTEALRPNERAFLDQIAEIAPGPPPPRPREPSAPLPHLRERPV